MKIYVLMENTTKKEDMLTEHGLSLYIETENHKILFDTGQSENFAINAERMGIDLSLVDIAFLSHGHYDHGGGLMKFFELNNRAKVYANKDIFVPHFNGVERYIGLDRELRKYLDRFALIENDLKIDNELEICTCNENERCYASYSAGLNMLKQGTLLLDDFSHEQYLLIHEGEKTVLLSGCSHKGILNIMTWMKADVVIGGFHLMNILPGEEGIGELKMVADTLDLYPVQYYTGHCTGEIQYEILKGYMNDRIEYLDTGMTVQI